MVKNDDPITVATVYQVFKYLLQVVSKFCMFFYNVVSEPGCCSMMYQPLKNTVDRRLCIHSRSLRMRHM